MSQRVIVIDSSELTEVERAAMIVATMAFPGPAERAKWDHAFKCLVARPLHERIRLEQDARPYLHGRLNRYLTEKTEDEAWKASRRVWKILEDRWEVGVVAAPWIAEMVGGAEQQLKPMSVNVLKDRVSVLFEQRARHVDQTNLAPRKASLPFLCRLRSHSGEATE